MWSSVVHRMTEQAARIPRAPTSEFNHFAAVVNRRGQILATGFNSYYEHAEEAVLRNFARRTRQPYTQRHKPTLPRSSSEARRITIPPELNSPCQEKRHSQPKEAQKVKVLPSVKTPT